MAITKSFRNKLVPIAKALTTAFFVTVALAVTIYFPQRSQIQAKALASAREIGSAIQGLGQTADRMKISSPTSWAVKTFKSSVGESSDDLLALDEARLPADFGKNPISEFDIPNFWKTGTLDYVFPISDTRGVRVRLSVAAPYMYPATIGFTFAAVFGMSFWGFGMNSGRPRKSHEKSSSQPSVVTVYQVPPQVVDKFRGVIVTATSLVKAAESGSGSSDFAHEAQLLRKALREAATEMALAQKQSGTTASTATKAG